MMTRHYVEMRRAGSRLVPRSRRTLAILPVAVAAVLLSACSDEANESALDESVVETEERAREDTADSEAPSQGGTSDDPEPDEDAGDDPEVTAAREAIRGYWSAWAEGDAEGMRQHSEGLPQQFADYIETFARVQPVSAGATAPNFNSIGLQIDGDTALSDDALLWSADSEQEPTPYRNIELQRSDDGWRVSDYHRNDEPLEDIFLPGDRLEGLEWRDASVEPVAALHSVDGWFTVALEVDNSSDAAVEIFAGVFVAESDRRQRDPLQQGGFEVRPDAVASVLVSVEDGNAARQGGELSFRLQRGSADPSTYEFTEATIDLPALDS